MGEITFALLFSRAVKNVTGFIDIYDAKTYKEIHFYKSKVYFEVTWLHNEKINIIYCSGIAYSFFFCVCVP